MRNLTLKQFRAIQAIVSSGKIINAANALGLSPPAVTIQLRQVEEEAGLALFDRTTEGMRPTAAGLAFVETAREIGANLIVIPSCGKTGLRRWMIGSVAEKVVRQTPCPVLVLPIHDPECSG